MIKWNKLQKNKMILKVKYGNRSEKSRVDNIQKKLKKISK